MRTYLATLHDGTRHTLTGRVDAIRQSSPSEIAEIVLSTIVETQHET